MLDYEILSRALYKLHLELSSSEAWEVITEESGVCHVKNMSKGKCRPTIETWNKLHETFPDNIPPPKIVADAYF